MNPAAEGTTYPAVPFTIEPSRVAAFRTLFGIDEGVPPTFVTVAEFAAFLQAAAHAPQPMHAAASNAASATSFGTGVMFASGAAPVLTLM